MTQPPQKPDPQKQEKTENPESQLPTESNPPLSESETDGDAATLRRWYGLPFLLKLLFWLLCFFAIVLIILYVMAGTAGGSKFLVDKLAQETGVTLTYGEGNLRDGLSVSAVVLKPNDDIDIFIDYAYVKIGWRAIFVKEVHLRDADIRQVRVIDRAPPTDTPYDYRTLDLPVNLRFDHANIDSIRYEKVTKEPVVVTDIEAKDLSWIGTTLDIGQANLQYADIVNIAGLQGEIDLQGNYPLNAKATVTVNSLEDLYVAPLKITANGSLKRTVGKVYSSYNDHKVSGDFAAQGLDEGAPFSAKLQWDELVLPYAESQDIRLQQGLLTASGVISDIELRINSHLSAENIPTGHYRGRAKVVDSQMLIDSLVVDSPEGALSAQGVLDWSKEFTAKAMIKGDGYKLDAIVPKEFVDYAPKALNGKLAVVYDNANADGKMQIRTYLSQKDGEKIWANIIQSDVSNNPRKPDLWRISARWQNLLRRDIPDIGNINSKHGQADVDIRGERLRVDANANIEELNAAPKGDYQVRLNKVGNRIHINSLLYKGVVGNLTGNGEIVLAQKNKPLQWKIQAQTSGLLPKAYQKDLPINRLVGSVTASGVMQDIKKTVSQQKARGNRKQVVQGQRHRIKILASDLQAVLDSTVENATANNTKSQTPEYRKVAINGTGAGQFDLYSGELAHFDAQFDGGVQTQGLPKGTLSLDANGSMQQINIKKLRHKGDAGSLLASGSIDLRQGIGWDIKADTDNFNIGAFVPQTKGIVSGNLVSQGHWQQDGSKFGNLSKFAVKFNGSLDTSDLPKGKLVVDADGNAQRIKLHQFSFNGDAGGITAQGDIDVSQDIKWDINATMDQFNIGYFVADMPSALSGDIITTGQWGKQTQIVHLPQIDVSGTLKGQPLLATGSLEATLHLPQDMQSYLKKLQQADAQQQVTQVQAIAEQLDANNLTIRWAENEIVANGDAQNLQAQVNIHSLDKISEQLAGRIKGGIIWLQPKGQALPTIYVDLVADQLAMAEFVLTQGHAKGKIVNLGKSPSQMVLAATGLKAAGRDFSQLNLVFDGTEAEHSVNLEVADTQATVKALLKGGFNHQQMRWNGVIGKGEVTSKYVTLQQKQPAELVADINNKSVQLAAHCWQAVKQTGKLCLRDNLFVSQQQGQINLVVQQLDTSLFSPFLPSDIDWQAQVNGKAMLSWEKGGQPNINATMFTDNGRVGLIQDGDSQPVSISYKRVSLIAKSTAKGLKLRTDINTGRGGRGYADILLDPYAPSKPISGALVLNELNLAIFKPFFPGMRVLEGNATMAGGLGGTLSSPVFYGDINLKNGRIAMLDMPVNLSNINAKARVRGQTATLNGTFNSGEGNGVLEGTIDWQQELQAKLSISGHKLIISQPPLLYAEINPDLDIIVRPTQRYVNIEGAVTVPEATIRPPEASKDVITKSEDVVVLDRRMIGNINEVLAISKPWSINANIGIDLGSEVNFRGFGATIPLAGAIYVTQQGQGVMQARGVIQVARRSKIDAFGQNLELNYGQIRFDGDVKNPALSIEAIKEIEGKTVGVRINGKVAEPNIIVFNNAGLTQEQAMNALVTGSLSSSGSTQISKEGFRTKVTNNLAAAGLSFGLSSTRGLTNSIGQAFGLQSLTVDAAGTGQDTNVNVTGYITPDLYIRYGVGVFNAESSFSLRYQLTRRIYIEATAAAENTVDMVYSWKF
ncbi:translocation/assembly module TamB domain-containing protein [Psychrobacter sp. I-STPA10]|uniref:translocation/assembly module TamB domain-containing protein n=1 Tax=Psychrobacter sp. I-STPA10 TaxID=2585769 RepID=UPI001E2EC86E|nr:translocation/assembly module TamB domain-containing protein [Psychrobacter sp. I-STPA10]